MIAKERNPTPPRCSLQDNSLRKTRSRNSCLLRVHFATLHRRRQVLTLQEVDFRKTSSLTSRNNPFVTRAFMLWHVQTIQTAHPSGTPSLHLLIDTADGNANQISSQIRAQRAFISSLEPPNASRSRVIGKPLTLAL